MYDHAQKELGLYNDASVYFYLIQSYSEHIHVVNVIFRPYGRKLSLKFRYFPSVRTEI